MLLTKKLFQNDEKKLEKELEKEWANAIKTRDGWLCAICGTPYSTNAHHIVPRENKQFKFCLDNGISLCTRHHKFSRIISAHNNPLAFFLWLRKYKPDLYAAAVKRNIDLCIEECNLL